MSSLMLWSIFQRKDQELSLCPPVNSKFDCAHDYGYLKQFINKADLSYFTESYLNKTPRWPRVCNGCDKNFIDHPPDTSKGESPENSYTVSGDSPVHLCQNGANSSHQCTFANCNSCYMKRRPAAGTPQFKRVRRAAKR